METQIQFIAALSFIDKRLDELHEEYGDLPEQVKELEDKAQGLKNIVDETEGILKDIRDFCTTSKATLIELKTKEEKLSKQQFKVRNNKEFDAITREISHLRDEHTRLTDQLRTEGVKEENLLAILKDQQENYDEAAKYFDEKKEELDYLASDQNEEVKDLVDKRKSMIEKINPGYYEEYERIRTLRQDASVMVKRNSCSGCFSAIPPQKIVELRNNLDTLYFCENCGRILMPEDLEVDEAILESI